MNIAIYGSGPGGPLAALAFSRLGLRGVMMDPALKRGGGESVRADESIRSVAVNPLAATVLRRWDLADCLEITPAGALVDVRQLERDSRRRLKGFGRFETVSVVPPDIRCTVDVERAGTLAVSGSGIDATVTAGIPNAAARPAI